MVPNFTNDPRIQSYHKARRLLDEEVQGSADKSAKTQWRATSLAVDRFIGAVLKIHDLERAPGFMRLAESEQRDEETYPINIKDLVKQHDKMAWEVSNLMALVVLKGIFLVFRHLMNEKSNPAYQKYSEDKEGSSARAETFCDVHLEFLVGVQGAFLSCQESGHSPDDLFLRSLVSRTKGFARLVPNETLMTTPEIKPMIQSQSALIQKLVRTTIRSWDSEYPSEARNIARTVFPGLFIGSWMALAKWFVGNPNRFSNN